MSIHHIYLSKKTLLIIVTNNLLIIEIELKAEELTGFDPLRWTVPEGRRLQCNMIHLIFVHSVHTKCFLNVAEEEVTSSSASEASCSLKGAYGLRTAWAWTRCLAAGSGMTKTLSCPLIHREDIGRGPFPCKTWKINRVQILYLSPTNHWSVPA